MRYLLSFLVIAFSISALLGGFMSGRAAVPRFSAVPTSAPQSTLPLPSLRAAVSTDEVPHDQFASDPAVVLASSNADLRDDARIALVVVNGGRSTALETPFLALNVPVTLVINPSGSAAAAMFRLARQDGDPVYVQADGPLTVTRLQALTRAFPGMSGIATRLTDGPPPSADLAALRSADLAFFDEYGYGGASAAFTRAGVRYAARGITVDDHAQRSYVRYMLAQAAHLARRRTAVVMARAFPGTLQAFQDFLARAPRDGVHIVELP